MDRTSFLSSLPFLIQSSSSEWPSRTTTSSYGSRHEEHFLGKQRLSVETTSSHFSVSTAAAAAADTTTTTTATAPAVVSGTNSSYVAYFDDNKDVALCTCELDFYVLQPNANNSNNVYRTPASMNNNLASNHILLTPTMNPVIATLSMMTNGRVYFVDWTQLEKVEVQDAQEKEADDNNNSKAAKKPSCMLLYFPSCIFRIFSLEAGSDGNDGAGGSSSSLVEKYRSLQNVLERVISAEAYSIMPALSNTLFDSPAGSTPVSSPNQEQQQDDQLAVNDMLGGGGASSSSSNDDDRGSSNNNNKKNAKLDQLTSRVEHKKRALEQCHVEMDSLLTVLNLPQDIVKKAKPNIGVEIFALMNTAAGDLSASFCRSSDIESMRQRQEKESEQVQQSMEQLLNEYFPAPRNKQTHHHKKLKRSGGGGGATAEQTLKKVQELLTKQKQVIQERHKLLGLPTRGPSASIHSS